MRRYSGRFQAPEADDIFIIQVEALRYRKPRPRQHQLSYLVIIYEVGCEIRTTHLSRRGKNSFKIPVSAS